MQTCPDIGPFLFLCFPAGDKGKNGKVWRKGLN